MSSASSSKKRGLSKEQGGVEKKDRISNLPCSIISYILSLLPTKSAVATSALSTRWKDMWKTTTNLQLHDKLLQTSGTTQSPQFKFTRFVYGMLKLRSYPCLHKFYLECGQGYEARDVNTWIAYVVKCGVRELHVSVPMVYSFLLPRSLFSSRNLVEVKLVENFRIDVPRTVWLPCLKSIDINGPKFSDDDSIIRLFSGCPALEKLSLRKCIGRGVRVISISAPVLTSLTIREVTDFQDSSDRYEIHLEAPMLSYLCICDGIQEGYEFGDQAHLVEANIGIGRLSRNRDEFPQEEKYSEALDNLFEAISGVQLLTLDGDTMEAIQVYYHALAFPNLIDLYLGVESTEDTQSSWVWLIRTLANSPQLRSLTFQEGFVLERGYECFLENEDGERPDCNLFGLKKIEIHKFLEQSCEFEMLELLLENANYLEGAHQNYNVDAKGLKDLSHQVHPSLVPSQSVLPASILSTRQSSQMVHGY